MRSSALTAPRRLPRFRRLREADRAEHDELRVIVDDRLLLQDRQQWLTEFPAATRSGMRPTVDFFRNSSDSDEEVERRVRGVRCDALEMSQDDEAAIGHIAKFADQYLRRFAVDLLAIPSDKPVSGKVGQVSQTRRTLRCPPTIS